MSAWVDRWWPWLLTGCIILATATGLACFVVVVWAEHRQTLYRNRLPAYVYDHEQEDAA